MHNLCAIFTHRFWPVCIVRLVICLLSNSLFYWNGVKKWIFLKQLLHSSLKLKCKWTRFNDLSHVHSKLLPWYGSKEWYAGSSTDDNFGRCCLLCLQQICANWLIASIQLQIQLGSFLVIHFEKTFSYSFSIWRSVLLKMLMFTWNLFKWAFNFYPSIIERTFLAGSRKRECANWWILTARTLLLPLKKYVDWA